MDMLQEILKVRGFQVAPAELEGHLLKHTDVDDCCVVGVPDEYSGEVPMAFVVLSAAAAKRVKGSAVQAANVKAEIAKVRQCFAGLDISYADQRGRSGSLITKLRTRSWQEESSSWTQSRKPLAGSFCAEFCGKRRRRCAPSRA
jgi:acyl-CoA synthetase (AMP-forming)/AMP-acid ligase II